MNDTYLKGYQPSDDDELIVGTGGFLINFSDKRLLPRPTQKRPTRRAARYPAQCPICQEWRLLRLQDANIATRCPQCHCRAIGKVGYARTVERWGKNQALAHVQEYQRANPSQAEQIVAKWLYELNIPHDTQVIWMHQVNDANADTFGETFTFLLDFVVPLDDDGEQQLLIEVNGPFHDPEHRLANPQRIARDQLLQAVWPGKMITLWAKDLAADKSATRSFFIERLNIILKREKI